MWFSSRVLACIGSPALCSPKVLQTCRMIMFTSQIRNSLWLPNCILTQCIFFHISINFIVILLSNSLKWLVHFWQYIEILHLTAYWNSHSGPLYKDIIYNITHSENLETLWCLKKRTHTSINYVVFILQDSKNRSKRMKSIYIYQHKITEYCI